MLKGLGALGDMAKMMKSAQEMQSKLAALQEDLSRAVPIRFREGMPAPEWGRIRSRLEVSGWVDPGTRMEPAGNCVLSLITENPDRNQVRWVDVDDAGTVTDVDTVQDLERAAQRLAARG